MQRIRANGWKRIILEIIPVIVLFVLIASDQWSKTYFHNLYLKQGETTVIPDFFYLTYAVNTGAAWSFLAGVSWAQTFFKILTSVSLIAFIIYYIYAIKRGFSWLKYSLVLIIGGTIGNFIDRIAFEGVTDFLSFVFWGNPFPVFNLADSFLTIGVIMLIIHYCFLDENAIFKKSSKITDEKDAVDSEEKENEVTEQKNQEEDTSKVEDSYVKETSEDKIE